MQDNAIELWLAPPSAASRLDPGRLGPADRARWQALRAPGRRVEWEASRALVIHLGCSPKASTSLAHSGGFAVLAVAPAGQRVGVDLQETAPRDVQRLAHFAYSPAEARQLAALPEQDANIRFHVLWALKEAFAKALELPLTQALRECRFLKEAAGWRGKVPAGCAWQAVVLAPRAELVLAAVVLREAGPAEPAWCCGEWPGRPVERWRRLAQLGSAAITTNGRRPRSRASCPRPRPAPGH